MNKKPFKEILEATTEASNKFRCPSCNVLCIGGTKLKTCGHLTCSTCPSNQNCQKCNQSYTRNDIVFDETSKSVIKHLTDIEIICNEVIFKTNVEKRNNKGETSLHTVCKRRNVSQVVSLLEAGSDPNVRDYAGWTPLHEAVLVGDMGIVEALVEAGAIIDVPGDLYVTPLQKAVVENKKNIVKYLIEHGGDVYLRNYSGLNALDMATEELKTLILNTKPKPENERNHSYSKPEKYTIYTDPSLNETPQYHNLENTLNKIDKLTITDTMTPDVTHFIIDEEIVDISNVSVLKAILNQIPVITFKWLEACAHERRILDYFPYYIKGTDIFQDNTIQTIEEYRNKMWPKLFNGLNFFIALNRTFKLEIGNTPMTLNDIIDIIKEGGGNLLKREPHIRNIEGKNFPWHAPKSSSIEECCNYVVYTGNPELKYNMRELRHVPVVWIIECVWRNKLIPLDEMQLAF